MAGAAFQTARIASPEEIAERSVAVVAGRGTRSASRISDERSLRLLAGSGGGFQLKVAKELGHIELEIDWK